MRGISELQSRQIIYKNFRCAINAHRKNYYTTLSSK